MIEYWIFQAQLSITLAVFGFVLYFILKQQFGATITGIIEMIMGEFADPSVKRAMTILSKKGVEANVERRTVDAVAEQVLSGPQLSGIKMAAQAIGVDIDALIEEHGAVGVIGALRQLGGVLGIDITQILSGQQLNTTTKGSSTTNPYLGGSK